MQRPTCKGGEEVPDVREDGVGSGNTGGGSVATTMGGGIYAPSGTLRSNLVVGNQALAEGGNACWMFDCAPGGDGIAQGGGIYAPEAMLVSNTVGHNMVQGHGGYGEPVGVSISEGAGIYADGDTMINNTIVWDNSPDQLAGQNCNNVTYCDIGDSVCSGQIGNISAAPCFADPNYHLQCSSPCIDTGDPNYPEDSNEYDIDGDTRIIGGRIDIGADEYTFGELSDFSGNGIVNFEDFAVLAYYWQDYVCEEPDWCEGCDYDESGIVDHDDLRRFAENWLWKASWYEY